MTPETCQFCNKSGNEWTGPTHQRAQARYYRCDTCGHVWSVDRDLAAAPRRSDADVAQEPARRNISPG
jgi:hypothetical protein